MFFFACAGYQISCGGYGQEIYSQKNVKYNILQGNSPKVTKLKYQIITIGTRSSKVD